MPHFSLEEKKKLQERTANSPLQAIQEIRKVDTVSLRDGKFVISHINSTYNVCLLNGQEYTSCSKCDSLNFNWNVNS